MIFTTFDVGFWYEITYTGKLSSSKYDQYLDLVEGIGFNYVCVDENLLPFVFDKFKQRKLKIAFIPSYVRHVDKKEDNSFDVIPFKDDFHNLSNEDFDSIISELRRILGIAEEYLTKKELSETLFNLNLGSYLESTFFVESARDILEGISSKYHDKNIQLIDRLLQIAVEYNFKKYIYHAQIIGFGAENKERYDLNPIAICDSVLSRVPDPSSFYYYTPTQSAHDSKYLLTNILNQKYMKDIYGISSGWGAMGVYGFPTTATSAYLNNIDLIHMVTNEKTYGKNRLTFFDFDQVEKHRIDLIKESIIAINNDDKDKILFLNRKYSQECSRYSMTDNKIYDEHFSLDGVR